MKLIDGKQISASLKEQVATFPARWNLLPELVQRRVRMFMVAKLHYFADISRSRK
jgi:hypothetical protein